MAANMIGVNKRIIAFDNEGEYMLMFNPEIVKKSGPYEAGGGLPVPHRHPQGPALAVHQGPAGRTKNSRQRIKTFTGWTAEIIQHEIDHCEGIVI